MGKLKEKQAKRKEIRAEQEKKLNQKKKEEEEKARKEEAEKKALEAEKKRNFWKKLKLSVRRCSPRKRPLLVPPKKPLLLMIPMMLARKCLRPRNSLKKKRKLLSVSESSHLILQK